MNDISELSIKTTTRSKLSIPRIVLGGIITGVVLFICSGIVNGTILSQDYKNWSDEMGNLIHPLSFSFSLGLWLIMSATQGVVSIWVYAGISRIYGVGMKSVLITGFLIWIVSKLAVAIDLTALGVLTPRIVLGQLIGSLVAILLGIYLGSRFYRVEEPE